MPVVPRAGTGLCPQGWHRAVPPTPSDTTPVSQEGGATPATVLPLGSIDVPKAGDSPGSLWQLCWVIFLSPASPRSCSLRGQCHPPRALGWFKPWVQPRSHCPLESPCPLHPTRTCPHQSSSPLRDQNKSSVGKGMEQPSAAAPCPAPHLAGSTEYSSFPCPNFMPRK